MKQFIVNLFRRIEYNVRGMACNQCSNNHRVICQTWRGTERHTIASVTPLSPVMAAKFICVDLIKDGDSRIGL